MKKSFVYVVLIDFEIAGGIFGQKLIGVTECSNTAFKLLENFDHMEFYKDNLIEGTVVTEGSHFKEIGVDDTNTAFFSETIHVHGKEDELVDGTIIKTIYQKELA